MTESLDEESFETEEGLMVEAVDEEDAEVRLRCSHTHLQACHADVAAAAVAYSS